MSIGVLMIHGFSGGPYEIDPLAFYIQKNTDWVIEKPTLAGHGEVEALALKGYKAEHWLMDAEIAYRKLSKKADEIYIVGFSMGGIIAMYLAIRYKVKKLVLLSAAAKYIAPAQILADLKKVSKDAIRGQLSDNELFKRYESKIKNVPVSSTFQFMNIVRQVEPYLKKITAPTFLVQGQLDGIVPYTTAQYLYDQLAAQQKELYISPIGKHHICYSNDCDIWFPKVLNFLKS
ncbi:alpha/beta fold hydrolase [Lysinibacillus yapensis]|uniref:Alpha/beta fold hydrolase n=1 Tax=Ureibacillus yapensis TaxID=2304605 RepID=A0A396S545_9BACL|nr:alpha/beta fold hydrolase [Lysinibacillus yapensis]RHW34895.1 alpha/beta fold hydrolase [Lysinibacillus yapensis]